MVDPNVLVSAAISADGIPRRILDAWHVRRFQMIVSYDLLYELETVLLRPYFLRRLTVSDVLDYVLWIREGAILAEAPASSAVEGSPDPDDDYLLALAMDQRVDVVSGNRHLHEGSPFLVLAYDVYPKSERVRVLTPRDFWDRVLVPRL